MNALQHPPASEIQELVDGRLDPSRVRDLSAHCDVCLECRRVRDNLLSLDAGLRRLPLERTGPAFTATLMNRLNLARAAKTQTRMFEFFAFAFGLLVVLAVVASAFLITGGTDSVLDPATQQIAAGASAAAESAMKAIAEWIPVGNLLAGTGARTLVFSVVAVILAGVADRFLRRRLAGG